MAKFKLNVWRTSVIEVEVEADNIDAAREVAFTNHINGDYDKLWDTEAETSRIEVLQQ